MIGFTRLVRRFIRRHTKPIDGEKAVYWKHKLSLIYMFSAWNTMGFVLYYCFTGRADWPLYYGLKTEEEARQRPGEYYSELLGLKHGHIVTVHGFKKVGEYEYNAEDTEKTVS